MKKELERNCDGCYANTPNTFNNLGCSLLFPPYKDLIIDISKCPCNICIIKMVCKDQCDERYKLWLNKYNLTLP